MIYEIRKVFLEDGSIELSTLGSPFVRAEDGTWSAIDMVGLRDNQGNQYSLVAEAHQNTEDEPMVTTSRLYAFATGNLEPQGEVDESPQTPRLTPDILAAIHDEFPDETLEVIVRLNKRPFEPLLALSSSLQEQDPLFFLDQYESRLLQIEDKKNVVEDRLSDFLTPYPPQIEVVSRMWLLPEARIRVDQATLALMSQDPALDSIRLPARVSPDLNGGDEVRAGVQVDELLDDAFHGQHISGRVPGAGAMTLGIVDFSIDPDHPAWLDGAPPSTSRLVSIDCVGFGTCQVQNDNHGSVTMAIAAGDLNQGQHPGIGHNSTWRNNRSGMSPETEMAFFSFGIDDLPGAIQAATAFNVDVANLSATLKSPSLLCNSQASVNDFVDQAMLSGIFWVNTPGNPGHVQTGGLAGNFCDDGINNGAVPGQCTVFPPGTAAGSFTVNGVNTSASDLKHAPIFYCNARGGDSLGRRIIALTAPTGFQGNYAAKPFSNYTGGSQGTSSAAPVISGTAINAKHQVAHLWGNAVANTPGRLNAIMALYGDGGVGTGSSWNYTMHDVWGGGRLKARSFTPPGMDTPWRVRHSSVSLGHGQTHIMSLNYRSGSNNPIPASVDVFRSAMWWFEPNVSTAGAMPNFDMRMCHADYSNCLYASSDSPQYRRLRRFGIGNQAWVLQITGTNVPLGTNISLPDYKQPRRTIHTAWYWEDLARNDGDGPPMGIE